jgi:hypothetical protein
MSFVDARLIQLVPSLTYHLGVTLAVYNFPLSVDSVDDVRSVNVIGKDALQLTTSVNSVDDVNDVNATAHVTLTRSMSS